MSSNRGCRFPQEALTEDEVSVLVDACGLSARGTRNKAILVLLWRTGMRCDEALSLRGCDVELDKRVARVLRPKGAGRGKPPRVVGLDDLAHRYLVGWHAVRQGLLLEDTDPLFVTQAGRRLDGSYLRRLLPKLARQAGIRRRVHPHALRHTFAFECVMEGRPLPWIQHALGHTSIVTTQRYLSHLAPADIIAGMIERGRSSA